MGRVESKKSLSGKFAFQLMGDNVHGKIVSLKDELEEAGESSNELALSNVGGVFLVLGIGVAVAFILAILEFLWNVRNVSVEEHVCIKQ